MFGVALAGSTPDLPEAPAYARPHGHSIARASFRVVDSIQPYRSAGIFTCSPSATPFGLALGPTNPGMTAIAQETLDFR